MKQFLIFCCIGLVSIDVAHSCECAVALNVSGVVGVVEEFYLSYCIDSSILSPDKHWLNFNFSSPKLHTLLRELSPSILRLGGSPADRLFFNVPVPPLNSTQLQPAPVYLQNQDLLNLLQLTKNTSNLFLLDLNVQVRYGYQWDPSNAVQVMEFCRQHNLSGHVAFELGNEPDWLLPDLITPKRLAKDFGTLHHLLDHYNAFMFMVGPDIVSTDGVGASFLKSVVDEAGQYLKAATFHHYYFRGDTATYKDYLKPSILASLPNTINNVHAVVRSTHNPNTPIWLGETSDAWHEGTVNVSDRFVSSFLWMDKLGMSALMGVGVVMRQTLYGFSYPLLDINMEPNPDYWLSWLFKRMVGERVLRVHSTCVETNSQTSQQANSFRVYSHCTRSSTDYKKGAVTMFGLNMGREGVGMVLRGTLGSRWVHVYVAQPDEGGCGGGSEENKGEGDNGGGDGGMADHNLRFDQHYYPEEANVYGGGEKDDTDGRREYEKVIRDVKEISVLSKRVRVNGNLMKMPSEITMPTIHPIILHTSQPIRIPNYSYFFLVFPDFNLDVCSN